MAGFFYALVLSLELGRWGAGKINLGSHAVAVYNKKLRLATQDARIFNNRLPALFLHQRFYDHARTVSD
jgi:hypothetical protein